MIIKIMMNTRVVIARIKSTDAWIKHKHTESKWNDRHGIRSRPILKIFWWQVRKRLGQILSCAELITYGRSKQVRGNSRTVLKCLLHTFGIPLLLFTSSPSQLLILQTSFSLLVINSPLLTNCLLNLRHCVTSLGITHATRNFSWALVGVNTRRCILDSTRARIQEINVCLCRTVRYLFWRNLLLLRHH